MTEPQIVNTLRTKRSEVEKAIKAYEREVEKLKLDLAHISATLAMFETDAIKSDFRVPMSIARIFRKGEAFGLCKKALEAAPDGLDTRELAVIVMEAKGLDTSDKVMRKAVALSLVNVLGMRHKRGHIGAGGMRKGVRVWRTEVEK
jgi:hypothetical protein